MGEHLLKARSYFCLYRFNQVQCCSTSQLLQICLNVGRRLIKVQSLIESEHYSGARWNKTHGIENNYDLRKKKKKKGKKDKRKKKRRKDEASRYAVIFRFPFHFHSFSLCMYFLHYTTIALPNQVLSFPSFVLSAKLINCLKIK